MKKLLALVLCVVMVLSLAPAAFADAVQPQPTSTATAKWGNLNAANKAISNTKKNIDYIYGALAADTAVFGTVQAMDSVVVDMVKGLLADVDTLEQDYVLNGVKGKLYVTHDALEKNAKAVLRNVIGGEIANYMNSHIGNYADISTHIEVGANNPLMSTGYANINGFALYVDAAGTIYGVKGGVPYLVNTQGITGTQAEILAALADAGAGRFTEINSVNYDVVQDYQYKPEKYAQTFATAVSKALSSEKGVANLQAYAYGLMQLKAAKAVDDKMGDLMDEIAKWEDGTRILKQYGFADFDIFGNDPSLDPYAFIDPENLPKASMDLSAITKGNETNFFVPDFPG